MADHRPRPLAQSKNSHIKRTLPTTPTNRGSVVRGRRVTLASDRSETCRRSSQRTAAASDCFVYGFHTFIFLGILLSHFDAERKVTGAPCYEPDGCLPSLQRGQLA